VIVRAVDATTIESVADLVCAGLPASVTVAVKLNVPLAVGVPEIRPVDEASERPAGRLPDVIDHEYGVVPPLADREFEYAVPGEPEGKLDVLIVKVDGPAGAAAIDRVTVAVAVLSHSLRLPPLESVTLTPKE
jgi:hypothetical protein